jgi:hypothetical protein
VLKFTEIGGEMCGKKAKSMTPAMKSELLVTGPEVEEGIVPAEAIVRLLAGMQQLALVFAAAQEGRPITQRFKPSAELKQRYSLRCGVPAPGSYHLPIDLADVSPHPGLFSSETLLERMQEFIAAVGVGDRERAKDILPDSKYRDRALREIRSFAPRPGEGWSASFVVKESPPVSLNGKLGKNIDEWLTSGLSEQTLMTVTGELVRINFDENKLFIRIPVSMRQLECTYMPEIEVNLLESRRDLIQVTGEFVVDHEGMPLRLTSVTRIDPVDISPFVFERVEFGGTVLRAKKPLEIVPKLDDETQQLYVASDEGLDLHAFSSTRNELADEIAHHLVFAWNAYARENPEKLTAKAAELAEALRERFEEIADAKR